jgi:hypothetical protein
VAGDADVPVVTHKRQHPATPPSSEKSNTGTDVTGLADRHGAHDVADEFAHKTAAHVGGNGTAGLGRNANQKKKMKLDTAADRPPLPHKRKITFATSSNSPPKQQTLLVAVTEPINRFSVDENDTDHVPFIDLGDIRASNSSVQDPHTLTEKRTRTPTSIHTDDSIITHSLSDSEEHEYLPLHAETGPNMAGELQKPEHCMLSTLSYGSFSGLDTKSESGISEVSNNTYSSTESGEDDEGKDPLFGGKNGNSHRRRFDNTSSSSARKVGTDLSSTSSRPNRQSGSKTNNSSSSSKRMLYGKDSHGDEDDDFEYTDYADDENDDEDRATRSRIPAEQNDIFDDNEDDIVSEPDNEEFQFMGAPSETYEDGDETDEVYVEKFSDDDEGLDDGEDLVDDEDEDDESDGNIRDNDLVCGEREVVDYPSDPECDVAQDTDIITVEQVFRAQEDNESDTDSDDEFADFEEKLLRR